VTDTGAAAAVKALSLDGIFIRRVSGPEASTAEYDVRIDGESLVYRVTVERTGDVFCACPSFAAGYERARDAGQPKFAGHCPHARFAGFVSRAEGTA
jgi:hypothetical protein